MSKVNLDAVHREQNSEPSTVEVDGLVFEIPARLTLKTMKTFTKLAIASGADAADALDVIMRALFGERADEAADHVGVDDLVEIIKSYGSSPGESSASPTS